MKTLTEVAGTKDCKQPGQNSAHINSAVVTRKTFIDIKRQQQDFGLKSFVPCHELFMDREDCRRLGQKFEVV